MQSRKQNLEKNRRVSLAIYMAIVTGVCLYAGLHLTKMNWSLTVWEKKRWCFS